MSVEKNTMSVVMSVEKKEADIESMVIFALASTTNLINFACKSKRQRYVHLIDYRGLLRLPMVCSFVAKLKSNGVGFDHGPFFVTAIRDEPGYPAALFNATDLFVAAVHGVWRCWSVGAVVELRWVVPFYFCDWVGITWFGLLSFISFNQEEEEAEFRITVSRHPYLGGAATSGMWLQPWRVFRNVLIFADLSLVGTHSVVAPVKLAEVPGTFHSVLLSIDPFLLIQLNRAQPEILEHVYTMEYEILQIQEAISIEGNNDILWIQDQHVKQKLKQLLLKAEKKKTVIRSKKINRLSYNLAGTMYRERVKRNGERNMQMERNNMREHVELLLISTHALSGQADCEESDFQRFMVRMNGHSGFVDAKVEFLVVLSRKIQSTHIENALLFLSTDLNQ
ncbi:hypothetical protein Tco_0392946 [Tanacetum coccineum]